MKSREELLRDHERSIFALMMDELGQEEGEEALREWETLERGEGFQASEESMARCTAGSACAAWAGGVWGC